mmetsp:Transcript_82997/g.130924  ORF Transcript_82997/g.130924 Transcript_82997/m.130924 type:complete len:553 (-) Transcript_82997:138-1796(-)
MPAMVPSVSAPTATEWLSSYLAEFGHYPGNAQQLCAFASNRGGRLPYSAAREAVTSEAPVPEAEAAQVPLQAWTPYPRQEIGAQQARQSPAGPLLAEGASPRAAAAPRRRESAQPLSITDALWNRLAVMESSASLSTSVALSTAELREESEGASANDPTNLDVAAGRPMEVRQLLDGPGDFGGGEELWEDYSASPRVLNSSSETTMEESDHQWLSMALEAEQWDRSQGTNVARNEESERWTFGQEATEEQTFFHIISSGLEVPESVRRNYEYRRRRHRAAENSEEADVPTSTIGEEVRRLLRQDPHRRFVEQVHAAHRQRVDSDSESLNSQHSAPSEGRPQLSSGRWPAHWSGLRRLVDRDILARTHASGILAELAHDAAVREAAAKAADEVAVQSFLGTLPEAQSESGVECAICLDDKPAGGWKELPCSHFYHEVCLSQWLNTSTARRSCPLCRLDLNLDSRSDEERLGARYPELAALRLAEASLEFEIAVQESEIHDYRPPSHFREVPVRSLTRSRRRHPTAIHHSGGADGRAEWQVFRRQSTLLRLPEH